SLDTCHGPDARSTASGEWKPPKACSVRDCRAVPRLGSRGGSAASAVAPGVDSAAADGRLRVRSASRPLHSQSLSPVGTLSDSRSPSLQGDKVWLQLWGDIILEHLHEQVRGLDNFATGKPENLAGLQSQFDFRESDILDLDAVRSAMEGVDYVLHQAALGSVPRSIADPARSNRVNVEGSLNVLVAARDAKVKRLVHASSSSVYGDTPTLPKREDMPPNPISPYSVSKLAAELYVRTFH